LGTDQTLTARDDISARLTPYSEFASTSLWYQVSNQWDSYDPDSFVSVGFNVNIESIMIDYGVPAIPEPSTWLLMFGGLFGIGLVARPGRNQKPMCMLLRDPRRAEAE